MGDFSFRCLEQARDPLHRYFPEVSMAITPQCRARAIRKALRFAWSSLSVGSIDRPVIPTCRCIVDDDAGERSQPVSLDTEGSLFHS